MKRAPVVLFLAAILVALAWPVSEAIGAAAGRERAVCREMTPARMLENPAVAQEWADALRSAQPGEVARVRAMIDEILAAHGCARGPDESQQAGSSGSEAPAREPGRLPPGHPPVGGGERQLPPGHPPVSDGAGPRAGQAPVPSAPTPLFHAPSVLEI